MIGLGELHVRAPSVKLACWEYRFRNWQNSARVCTARILGQRDINAKAVFSETVNVLRLRGGGNSPSGVGDDGSGASARSGGDCGFPLLRDANFTFFDGNLRSFVKAETVVRRAVMSRLD